MAEAQAFASTLGMTDTIISGFDLMHKPEVYKKVVGRYPTQRDLGFLEELGSSEEVKQTSYSWGEENIINAPFTIAAKATVVANTTVRITLAAEDHYQGIYSNVRVNDVVRFKNGASGIVIAKNETVASAHTIDVQRSNAAQDPVAAAVVGQKVGIFSMAFAEGSAGYSQSIVPRITTFSAQLQIFKDTFRTTTTEIGNQTWFEFEYPEGHPKAGEMGQFLVIKAEGDTYDRYNLKREMGLMTNDQDDGGIVINGSSPIRLTRGFIPHLKLYGELMDYASKPSMGTFETMQRLLKKNFQMPDVVGLMGLDFAIGLTSFATDLVKNGGVLYNSSTGKAMDSVSLGFKKYEFASGFNFHMKTLNALADANTTGLTGSIYPGMCIICPTGTSKAIINGSEKQMAPITVRWKKPVGGGAQDGGTKGRYKMWYTGGGADTPTNDIAERQLNIHAEEGLQVLGAKRFILCTKAL